MSNLNRGDRIQKIKNIGIIQNNNRYINTNTRVKTLYEEGY